MAIAGTIHKSTTTLLGWTAKRPQMKSEANVTQEHIPGKTASKLKIGWQKLQCSHDLLTGPFGLKLTVQMSQVGRLPTWWRFTRPRGKP
jgi:hypothetical protein